MSGEKYTEIRLQRERQEKLNLLQSLQSLQSESAALQKQLADQVNGLSEGLRSTFDTEVAASQQWLHGTTPAGKYSMDHSLDAIRQAQRRQEQITTAGRTCLANLQLALTQKADALGRAVAEQRVAVTQLLLQHSEVLRLWYGAEAVAAWESRLEQAAQRLEADHYHEAEGQFTALQSELQAKADQATKQETQHQRRLYLLKALRQVAADLKFTEDSRGQTVFFTETVIIFTSNIGASALDSRGNPIAEQSTLDRLLATEATDNDRQQRLREHFRSAVENFFLYEIARPELLNRIGNNIIPFNYIHGVQVQKNIMISYRCPKTPGACWPTASTF